MSAGPCAPVPRPYLAAALAALLVVGYLGAVPARSLANPDEPRVAWIGWSMSLEGADRVVPRLNGEPFLQEPPLYHWLSALVFRALGSEPGREWVARVPSVASVLATVLLVVAGGARLLGARAGLLAGLVLVSLFEYLEVGNRASADALLTFLVTAGGLSVVALASVKERPERRPADRWAAWWAGWWALLGGAAGLAFLAKNLLGPVDLALVLAAALACRRELRRPARLAAGLAIAGAAFLAAAGPWLLLLGLEDPAHLRTLLLENTWGRFTSQGRHDPPLGEFLLRILWDWLPWTPLLPFAVVQLFRRARGSRAATAGGPGEATPPGPHTAEAGRGPSPAQAAVLLAWIALPTLLVLASGSKRNLYLLPVCPALALAVGAWLDSVLDSPVGLRLSVPLAGLGALALVGVALLGGIWAGSMPAAVFLALASGLYFLYLWARRGGWRSPSLSAAAAIVVLAHALAAANLARYRYEEPRRSYGPLEAGLRDLKSEGFEFLGFRLGLRELSAVGWALRTPHFPNLESVDEARARLASSSPPGAVVPVAVVIERRVLENEGKALLESRPEQIPFEVSRGIEVLLSRPAR